MAPRKLQSSRQQEDLRRAKSVVWEYFQALDGADAASQGAVLERFCTPNYLWRATHPFHEQTGTQAVASAFWEPFRRSFRYFRRRVSVFMAGRNELDGERTVWVCSMGHLCGVFGTPWVGIPSRNRVALLPYAEFHRVEDGRLAEGVLFVDLLSLIAQQWSHPLAPQTGTFVLQPGPRTQDGILHEPQDPEASAKTLRVINRMTHDIGHRAHLSQRQVLARSWCPGMIWWGPTGIGATYTIERYIAQHQRPFREHTNTRRFNGHVARFAEGHFGGFFGWANLTMDFSSGFLGLPMAPGSADMRVVDIYRREGDKLAENWVFIDILHFLYTQGCDVLARLEREGDGW